MKKLLNYLLIINGALLVLLGTSFVLMYFWQALVLRAGNPDQSDFLWFLTILMLGLIMAPGGLFLLIKGIKKINAK